MITAQNEHNPTQPKWHLFRHKDTNQTYMFETKEKP